MTDKPNYNDGNWHGWNGGECPVHPKSEVECLSGVIPGKRNVHIRRSGDLVWGCIVAFRVVKEHREPREFWLMTENGIVRSQLSASPSVVPHGWECVHVREVLP